MTCNISSSPPLHEAPPLYTARASDPETASIHSAAPSYTSEAPSYHSEASGTYRSVDQNSTPNPTTTNTTNLGSNLAPPASNNSNRDVWRSSSSARAKLSEVDVQAYKIPPWSSVRSSPQERHYHSVAHRRALAAANNNKDKSSSSEALRVRLPPVNCGEDILEEDPYLVGSEAADRARRERLIGEGRGEEVLRREDKAWDFMISQMADWEVRQRSWTKFKSQAEKTGLFRRRVGIFGVGKW